MATESKARTYIVPLDKVFNALQNQTGKAPIASIFSCLVEEDSTAIPPNRAWFFVLEGRPTPTHYDTQKYHVTAAEVAAVLNNHTGQSFTAANIIAITRYEGSFIQVETA